MPELIDRQALRLALAAHDGVDQTLLDLVDSQPSITPGVVCNIEGGMLQGASATHHVDVYALDYDTHGIISGLIQIDDRRASLSQASARIDPDLVQQIVDAPEITDEDHTS